MRNSQKLGQVHLGQVLINARRLTAAELAEAEEEQQATGEKLCEVLLARGLVTEFEIASSLVSELGLPLISPKAYDIPEEVKHLVPAAVLHAHQIVPLDRFGSLLLVASWGNVEPGLISEIESLTKLKVCFVISQKSDIEQVLEIKYPRLDVGREVHARLDQLFGS